MRNLLRCDGLAFTARLGLATALVALAWAAVAAEAWQARIQALPQTALMRQFMPIAETTALPQGLVLSRHCRWLPELDALLIECELRNPGQVPATVAALPLLELEAQFADPRVDAPYSRLTYRQEVWYGSTFWTGPDWTRVGKDWHHPGENTPSVRTFVVPRDGRFTITGTVRKLHLDGDGIRVAIRHGLELVWSAELEGKDDKGQEPNLTVEARRGDRLRFVVHKRGTIFCDTTYWDPLITEAATGEHFQASASFSTSDQGLGGWFYEQEDWDPGTGRYEALTYSQAQWYGSTFWTGPDWTRVGKDWHHPGENTASVRAFRVPRAGRVTVTGRVRKLHLAGDGVRVAILQGATQVWGGEIDGADDKGLEPNLTLAVKAGEFLRFVVDKRGTIACDTTGWDPRVAYADTGEGFAASAAFGAKQGEQGWFYQMLSAAVLPSPTVGLHAVGPDFGWRATSLVAGQAVTLKASDMSGLAVLDTAADGGSSLALGVEPTVPLSLRLGLSAEQRLSLVLAAESASSPLVVPAAGSLHLPTVALADGSAPWTTAIGFMRRIMAAGTDAPLAALAESLRRAHARTTADLARAPDPDLLLLVQAEWQRDDRIKDEPAVYAAAVTEHLTRAAKLADDLGRGQPGTFLAAQRRALPGLSAMSQRDGLTLDEWRGLYLRTRLVKRDIALANPLLTFDRLLFCKRVPTWYSHLVMQYYGWRARPGGGLFVLERPGCSLQTRDLLAGQLPEGSMLEPRLSCTAREVVFSFVRCDAKPCPPESLPVNEQGPDERYYHIYLANTDGTGLRQLTAGPYDDLMPEFLPDGGLVFSSTRRRGYSRCFGAQFSRRWDSYTLHRMDRDGGGLEVLSLNDVSEWFPSISNSGQILYARWDYIDRDAVTHQNLWAMRPDGTNTIAVWGNASSRPHCVFQPRAIPSSPKIAFIASAHHSITGGPLCVLDPTVDANSQSAITRLTPGPFPEAEPGPVNEYYESPWPLSEQCFLVAYSPQPLVFEPRPNPPNALGLYLLDAAGNRELLYRDPAISSMNPMPLAPRLSPPVLTNTRTGGAAEETGEMLVCDVYRGLGSLPRGRVRELRIVQIFPKTTPVANSPRIGFAGEENARAVLGTVPVAADGSVRFVLPARKSVLFQLLDENGCALQTMRSLVYVQPGERTACVGCHENRMTSAVNLRPSAMYHPPTAIRPGELGGRPFSYMEMVQPVLDRHCIRCHSGAEAKKGVDLTRTPVDGFAKSYRSLCRTVDEFNGGATNPETAAKALVPRFGQRNQIQVTPPGGTYGALGSRLLKMLRAGHNEVKLSDAEFRRLAAWIDLNAIFYGAYAPEDQARQLAGESLPMPEVQ